MYGIFTHIWLKFMVNVDKYTIHGSYGIITNEPPENPVNTFVSRGVLGVDSTGAPFMGWLKQTSIWRTSAEKNQITLGNRFFPPKNAIATRILHLFGMFRQPGPENTSYYNIYISYIQWVYNSPSFFIYTRNGTPHPNPILTHNHGFIY